MHWHSKVSCFRGRFSIRTWCWIVWIILFDFEFHLNINKYLNKSNRNVTVARQWKCSTCTPVRDFKGTVFTLNVKNFLTLSCCFLGRRTIRHVFFSLSLSKITCKDSARSAFFFIKHIVKLALLRNCMEEGRWWGYSREWNFSNKRGNDLKFSSSFKIHMIIIRMMTTKISGLYTTRNDIIAKT